MNLFQEALMGKPSIGEKGGPCPFCGRPATERHHIVPRSQGGTDGPTIWVCGFGNAGGCHGLLHGHKLHLRWNGGWECLKTKDETKYEDALEMRGWRRL